MRRNIHDKETLKEKLKRFGKWIISPYTRWRWHRLTYHNKDAKAFYKSVKEAVPFDFGSFDEVMLCQLRFMKNYFDRRLYTTDETYDTMLRWLNLAIRCLEIVLDVNNNLYHFDGEFKMIPSEDHPGCYTADMKDWVYHCDVNVNIRNLSRFEPNKEYQEGYLKHPADFYQLKARYLFAKIYAQYSRYWWD